MLKRFRHSRRGSAMVEFALVAPLLILVLLGIMVMGVVINAKLVVAGAAREAGRTYAIYQDASRARSKAAEAVAGGGLKWENGNASLFNPDQDIRFSLQGEYVTATVTYRQPTFVPLISELIDSHGAPSGYISVTSQAIFRVER